MTNEPLPSVRAAEALTSKYEIGNSSRFCDDAPDWDAAYEHDITKIIADTTQCDTLATSNLALAEANRELLSALEMALDLPSITDIDRRIAYCNFMQQAFTKHSTKG